MVFEWKIEFGECLVNRELGVLIKYNRRRNVNRE